MIPSRAIAHPFHPSALHIHDDTCMTNTSGFVLCCSRDYLFVPIIVLFYCRTTIYEDFDRSDRWDSTAISSCIFSNPIRLVLRLAAMPRAPFSCYKYNFLSYSCPSVCSSEFCMMWACSVRSRVPSKYPLLTRAPKGNNGHD
jgi:hypothetical protein